MAVIIKYCDCKGTPASEFQDKTYGKGMRVHNEKLDGKGSTCTCCGKEKK